MSAGRRRVAGRSAGRSAGSRASRGRRPPYVAATLAGAVLAAAIPLAVQGRSADPTSPGSVAVAGGRPVAAASLPDLFTSQQIHWQPCLEKAAFPGLPSAFYRLQCGWFSAPLDWQRPDPQARVRVSITRLPATVQAGHGVTFTNPGGPGASGRELPLLFALAGRKELMRTQDVYGIDVRGTGSSTNLSCGGAASPLLDPRDRSTRNLDLLLDAVDLTARLCGSAGQPLIDHVTTADTVRDLDLLRSLVGAPTVNWIGYSAGTWLGAHYATAFPDRVGRFVLDSAVDVTGTWEQAFARQPLGFERRFRADFAAWVARSHASYGLGRTPEAVLRSYERIRAGMTPDSPLDSAVLLDRMLASAMYSSLEFPDAATTLADLKTYLDAEQAGNVRAAGMARRRVAATARRIESGRSALPGRQPLASDAASATFLAITCNDTPWASSRAELIQRSEATGAEHPLIGYQTVSEPCAFWIRPDVDLPVPTGAGAPPMLIVQSERDPATPIEGAQLSAARLAGARMLRVTGSGDHGLYSGGNTCVDTAVEEFLVRGALPTAGATCAGNAMPGPADGSLIEPGAASQSGGSDRAAAGLSKALLAAPARLNPLRRLQLLRTEVTPRLPR